MFDNDIKTIRELSDVLKVNESSLSRYITSGKEPQGENKIKIDTVLGA